MAIENIFKIIFAAFLCFSFISCKDDEKKEEEAEVTVSSTTNEGADNDGNESNESSDDDGEDNDDSTEVTSFQNTKALDFNSVDTDFYLNGGNESSVNFDVADPFSFCFWIKPNSNSASDAIITKYDGSTGYSIGFNSDKDISVELTATTNVITLDTDSAITEDVWSHICVTYAGTGTQANDIKIYVDGSTVSSTAVNDNDISAQSMSSTGNFEVGVNVGSLYGHYLLDELAVFNVELTPSAIEGIYDNNAVSDLSGISGVQNWWRLGDDASDSTDSGSSGKINDQVGSFDLTPTNDSNDDAEIVTTVPMVD